MSNPTCHICGGEIENWKGKPSQKPEHKRESLCLASALLRIADQGRQIKSLQSLLWKSRLFIPDYRLNKSIIEEIKDALKGCDEDKLAKG